VNIADPIIGLIVTFVILRITWQSFNTVRNDPGEPDDVDGDHSDQDGHDHDGHDHEHAQPAEHAHGH
jgi:ABC-type nickel/cobalt efflux system permease component RcnA